MVRVGRGAPGVAARLGEGDVGGVEYGFLVITLVDDLDLDLDRVIVPGRPAGDLPSVLPLGGDLIAEIAVDRRGDPMDTDLLEERDLLTEGDLLAEGDLPMERDLDWFTG